MRVLIAGAGALGSVFGGFLRRAGLDVTLLGRTEHLAAVADRGLTIDGIWGTHRVTGFAVATEPGALHGPFDAILVPVKSFDTEPLARIVAPLLAADGVAISLIDGAGVPAVYTDRLAALLWAKVFYNAALNPLGALLGVHYGALPESVHSRALMDDVMDEAFEVARAECVVLPWANAAAYRDEFYGRLVPATYDHRSSMLQDLERGRRTEIDAINGAVWRRGAEHGIKTPVNATLTRLIHAVEATHDR